MDSRVTAPPDPGEVVESPERSPKLCVYTSLMGDYEALNEQPMALRSEIPFICFTDDPDLQSETWQVRVVSPMFAMDPARSQRDLKLRPHVHLPEFDLSLYIDNAVILTQPPEQIFERYGSAAAFSLARHEIRASVLDEFLEVAKQGYDDPGRVFEQLNHYTLVSPEILEERPYWGGIQLRDHRDAAVRDMLDIWYANVLRYSRRDQLSLNAAFRQAGLEPNVMDINNYSSWFHSWPHTPKRNRTKGALSPSVSFSPPVALVRRLQNELAQMEEQREEMIASDEWCVGKWLTESAKRHPLLVGPVLRMFVRLSQRGHS